ERGKSASLAGYLFILQSTSCGNFDQRCHLTARRPDGSHRAEEAELPDENVPPWNNFLRTLCLRACHYVSRLRLAEFADRNVRATPLGGRGTRPTQARTKPVSI